MLARTQLKNRLKALAYESKEVRKQEKHILTNVRKLKGIVPWNKKHQKGEERPARPVQPQVKLPVKEVIDKEIPLQEYEFFGLHRYRTHFLRKEARHMHLAYGFLKGKKYSEIESVPGKEPIDVIYFIDTIVTNCLRHEHVTNCVRHERQVNDFLKENFKRIEAFINEFPKRPEKQVKLEKIDPDIIELEEMLADAHS